MLRYILVVLVLTSISALMACHKDKVTDNVLEKGEIEMDINSNLEETRIIVQVGKERFSVVIYDNNTAKELIKMLPLTLNMSDLNRNEKYIYLDKTLPSNSEEVIQINNGDLMLYGSNCIVLFYESFLTSYSYTPLGYIENSDGLRDALGRGNVTVIFSGE